MSLEKVSVRLADKPIIKDLTLEIRAGDILLITGPNGCGKSTLLKCCAGLLAPNQGRIHRHISSQAIGYLPQVFNPTFSVPMTLADVASCLSNVDGQSAKSQLHQWQLLTQTQSLLSWQKASGGEKMRTLLGSLLLTKPRLLLLDEPFNHIDFTTMNQLHELLQRYVAQESAAIMMVSHQVPKDLTSNPRVRVFAMSLGINPSGSPLTVPRAGDHQ
jgi:ABC-type Mn2+/Zn2+ transport system ATPase subunit